MALKGYKSNNNVVYSSKYHVVWTPKYRRSALLGPTAKRCKAKAGVSSHTLRQVFSPTKISAADVVDEQLFGVQGGWGSAGGHKQYGENQKNI
jgi:hypothetical protein